VTVAEIDPVVALRAELARRGIHPAQVAELIDHVRCGIEARLDAAVPIDLATRQAIAELGDLRTLAEAFHQESQMHPMNKLLGFAFALGVIYLAARLTGTRAEILVTPIAITPLVTIAGMVLGGLTASFGLQQLRRLIAVTVLGRPAAAEEIALLQAMCQRGQRLAWSGAMLTLVFSAIHIMSVLDQPLLIGPAIGWALLALAYGALIAELGFGSAERWIAPQTA
jgi:hypothetical protein